MSSRRKWAAWNGSTRSHTDKYKITNKQIQIKDHTHTNRQTNKRSHTNTITRSRTDKYKITHRQIQMRNECKTRMHVRDFS